MYSEVAPKRGVFSMYGRADVYNYQVIVETPSELKCLETLPMR